jgi:DnaJ-class molecular chaperone
VTSKCHVCKGNKLVDSMDAILVYVERGTPDGYTINYRDQADEYINVRPGSINIQV